MAVSRPTELASAVAGIVAAVLFWTADRNYAALVAAVAAFVPAIVTAIVVATGYREDDQSGPVIGD